MALSKITTASLSDNAVTTAKITDANITTSKVADTAITTAKITDANITTAKVADDAITTAKVNPAQTDITSVGTLSSATISGDLTVDTNTLKIDATNNKVGINQASPQDEFHVKGFARIEAEFGNAPYIRYDNTANSGGVMWRAGSASGHTNWDIYNQTDNKFIATFHKDGYVTKPLQPVLSLFGDTVRVQASGQNTDTDVSFSERIDNTNSYDTANKYFDVPFSGKYLVNFYASVKSDTSYIMIKIKVGTTTEAISYGEEPNINADWVARSCQTILDLTAGDAVRFQLTTGSSTSGGGQILESKYRGVHMFLLA